MIRGYFGSKTASGLIQKIVSLMPKHDRYIEPFVGGGAILESKRPSRSCIAADADGDVIRRHLLEPLPGVDYRHVRWDELLPSLELTASDLIYLDPPYHLSTRGKDRYKFDFDDDDHRKLLAFCRGAAPARVMISGYRCEPYDVILNDWRRFDFGSMTRGGPKTESVWTNFEPGVTFHDTRFLGGDYRGRERIKRKRARWVQRFMTMAAEDRAVIWEALEASTARLSRDLASSSAAALQR